MKQLHEKFPLIFFLVILVAGFFLYDDYGISWDEPIQRDLGNANWNYVLHGDDSLFHLINQYHGPLVEMIEILPEKTFHLKDEKTIFLSRHLINYFIFWLGLIFLFLLGKDIFRNQWLALLAVAMLLLTPRIFAQSFYNSKDLPLLSFFIICNYYALRFIRNPTFTLAVTLAFVSGMLFAIRIVGIIVPAFTVGFFILNFLNGNLYRTTVKFLLLFLILFPLFAIAFYPVLWHNPLAEVTNSFAVFSHYFYDDPQFFMGKLIRPQDLPWYYIPIWMGMTIPPAWQIIFLIGVATIIFFLLKEIRNFFRDVVNELYLVSWLLLPWLIVVYLHSTVYDEWRHLFFIYPAFILIGISGVRYLLSLQKQKLKTSLVVACAGVIVVQAVVLLQFMIANHPFENVYFNFLAGKHPEKKFDLDYWGLSYRQGLQYLAQNVREDTIKVCWQNAPGSYNLIWLNEKERSKIKEAPFDSCEYFLTNFRFHPDQYTDSAWYSIRVNNFSILAIEKLR